MIAPRTAAEVEQRLSHWAMVDERAGNTAAARRVAVLTGRGVEVVEYEFRERPNDWVHRDWMRPVRFVYRNIPRGIRMQLKKRLAE
nr:hypothetical protein [Acidobacteriota bacterium]